MSPAEVERAVDCVLDAVDFTDPVDLEDVAAVHQAIRLALPEELRLESYHRIRDVVFEVRARASGKQVCKRVKKVVAP